MRAAGLSLESMSSELMSLTGLCLSDCLSRALSACSPRGVLWLLLTLHVLVSPLNHVSRPTKAKQSRTVGEVKRSKACRERSSLAAKSAQEYLMRGSGLRVGVQLTPSFTPVLELLGGGGAALNFSSPAILAKRYRTVRILPKNL